MRDLVLVDHAGTMNRNEPTDETATVGPVSGCAPRPPAGGSPFRRAKDLLRVRLRISAAEAGRRIALAHRVLPRQMVTGEMVPPPLEHLGDVIASISGDSARHVIRAVKRVRPLAGPELAGQVEQTLAEEAVELDPDAIGVLADRAIALLDPDGPAPRESDLRQGLYQGPTHDGLTSYRLVVDQTQREILQTILDTGTNPRTTTTTSRDVSGGGNAINDGAGGDVTTDAPASGSDASDADADAHALVSAAAAEAVRADTRSRARRMLDALMAAAGAALRVGDLPQIAGLPPQVLVTMQLNDLLTSLDRNATTRATASTVVGTPTEAGPPPLAPPAPPGLAQPFQPTGGIALLPHAGPVPIHTVRRLACDADLIPIVLGTDGRLLDVGHHHRLVPAWMRRVLIARDHGCTFPGCTIPATWCEAHHIISWLTGGTTSTDNSLLLCPAHHHLIHATNWTLTHTPTGIHFRPPWSTLPTLTTNPMHTGATPRTTHLTG
ncbi:hypothetical protein C8046_02995 [Serinibacter arcticus]|uniref:HNH nuclease domain-containing protein n=2 Tax=Serinibacter arcticus TaxID=1655435 RepID=A0A2U1ZZA1_9MICO|nr:hypothetical protein C8046_02995 [Serinibacter arcticus]